MKNTFYLVFTYSWSSLSLPTPNIRKTSKSYMVSAAYPLVKWHPTDCSYTTHFVT